MFKALRYLPCVYMNLRSAHSRVPACRWTAGLDNPCCSSIRLPNADLRRSTPNCRHCGRNTGPPALSSWEFPAMTLANRNPVTKLRSRTFARDRFDVTFPMTKKQSILGRDSHPLFIAMREEYTSDILPTWNFFKYLFGRDGNLLHHWPSSIEPDEPGFRHEIERNLSSWRL